jgi:hypothetical protein
MLDGPSRTGISCEDNSERVSIKKTQAQAASQHGDQSEELRAEFGFSTWAGIRLIDVGSANR